MYRLERERGVALILTFIVFVGLSAVAFAFLTMITYETRSVGTGLRNMQAFYIAEAGRAKARWALTVGEETPGAWGEEDIEFGKGTYTVTTTDNGAGTCTITSYGYIPHDTNPVAQRQVVEDNIPLTSESPNISLDATASASSEKSPARYANDGLSDTRWVSAGGNGSWLAMDFGSSITFDKVVFEEVGNKIQTYEIQHATDGSNWSAVTNATESVDGDITTVTFDPVSDRYVRLFISTVSKNRPSIAELETYNTAEESIVLGQGKFITSL